MVLPAKNITPSESSILPEIQKPGNIPEAREEVTELFPQTQTPEQNQILPESKNTSGEVSAQPEPAKKVDPRDTQEVKDTPITNTPDEITTLADTIEKDFRNGVDLTAHDQHS